MVAIVVHGLLVHAWTYSNEFIYLFLMEDPIVLTYGTKEKKKESGKKRRMFDTPCRPLIDTMPTPASTDHFLHTCHYSND